VEIRDPEEPCYVISVVAKMVEVHPQTLRSYERIGLVKPARSPGNVRLYSARDVERLRKICRLTEDLGVNLAGAEVILNLTEKLEALREEMDRAAGEMRAEIDRLRNELREVKR
jgi:MerR family transcriptional regulator/heat shock protein HspR